MPTTTFYGYLDRPYLDDNYLDGVATYSIPTQVDMKILDFPHIDFAQVDREILDYPHHVRSDAELLVDDFPDSIHSQSILTVDADDVVHAQVDRRIDSRHHVKAQVNLKILDFTHIKHGEVRFGTVLIENCGDAGYLDLPYLDGPYLAPNICAHIRTQVDRKTKKIHSVHSQVNREIVDHLHVDHAQTKRRIDTIHTVHGQIDRIHASTVHGQIRFLLYNTYNLRILKDFPSRGISGTNWTANSTMAGDFSVLNVNTDIVEQVWRSDVGVKTGLQLSCDTEITQGVFLDTLALLNHNMTTSASVVLQGSNDGGFSIIGFTETLEVADEPNLYYIAPTLPTDSFRYWRLLISDGTNTADYIQIGTIVFGAAIIFQGETMVDSVRRKTVHFSDKIKTEGFTAISNDRALKFAVGLEFRNLKYNKDNYNSIRSVFLMARTSLKCLWIPTPDMANRFAVFGKLTQIPDEIHNVKGVDLDFVDFTVEVDESL